MSDTKWTPGPWVYEPTDYPGLEDTVAGQMGRVMQADHGDYTICQLCDFSEDEILANAHLIAAAPEIYEALQDTRETIQALINEGYNGYVSQRDRIDRALAKARGES